MPETKVTTAITAATPITTPSTVSTERSLFAHRERSAMRMDSTMCMDQVFGVRSCVFWLQLLGLGDPLTAQSPLALAQHQSNRLGSIGIPKRMVRVSCVGREPQTKYLRPYTLVPYNR